MCKNSKLARLVLVSPYFLLLFLLLPGAVIFTRVLHVRLPFSVSTGMLLFNNICLLVCLLVRMLRYLSRLRSGMRYDSEYVPRHATVGNIESPASRVREELSIGGFRFDAAGFYGEKRGLGYLGTILLYGGLFFVLLVGTWENLRQFSGTVIKGPGAALDLSQAEKYYHLVSGPLASPASLPLLKVTKQIFPGSTHPMGATEISLYDKNGKGIGGAFLDPMKEPCRFGGYDVYLNGLLADLALQIRTKGSFDNDVFDDAVKVRPLYGNKVGDFTLYGPFTTPAGDDGEVWYDPTHNVFRIALSRKGVKLFETDYTFQAYREKEEGKYVVSILGMGHWSEIHVVRRRHMPLVFMCGIVAAVGLLMRLVFPPQRVWLEETENGNRVKAVGNEAKRLLGFIG